MWLRKSKWKNARRKKKFESVVFGSMKIKGGSKVIPFVKLWNYDIIMSWQEIHTNDVMLICLKYNIWIGLLLFKLKLVLSFNWKFVCLLIIITSIIHQYELIWLNDMDSISPDLMFKKEQITVNLNLI